jgi:hypothetical protein
MWARVVELMIGLWLCISPLLFRGTASAQAFTAIDLTAGSAVVVLSLLSFWSRTARAHLVTLVLAIGLGAFAWLAWPRPGPPAAQNELMAAMLLALFAIIPNEASAPPRPWRRQR